jgi:hypothetical protein
MGMIISPDIFSTPSVMRKDALGAKEQGKAKSRRCSQRLKQPQRRKRGIIFSVRHSCVELLEDPQRDFAGCKVVVAVAVSQALVALLGGKGSSELGENSRECGASPHNRLPDLAAIGRA